MDEGSLSVVDDVAAESHHADDDTIRRHNRLFRRGAQVSVGVVTIDLLVRYVPLRSIIRSVTSSGQSPSPAFETVGSLSSADSILVLTGVLVVGSVVGLVLAVTLKR